MIELTIKISATGKSRWIQIAGHTVGGYNSEEKKHADALREAVLAYTDKIIIEAGNGSSIIKDYPLSPPTNKP